MELFYLSFSRDSKWWSLWQSLLRFIANGADEPKPERHLPEVLPGSIRTHWTPSEKDSRFQRDPGNLWQMARSKNNFGDRVPRFWRTDSAKLIGGEDWCGIEFRNFGGYANFSLSTLHHDGLGPAKITGLKKHYCVMFLCSVVHRFWQSLPTVSIRGIG